MQFLEVTKDLTLSALSAIVGERNVDAVLNANGIFNRAVDIGKTFLNRKVADTDVDYQTQINILNQFVGDSDLFEKAALGTKKVWQSLAQFNTFPDALRIPPEIILPPSVGILGNGEPVIRKIYEDCMNALRSSQPIDPTAFSEYNALFTGASYGAAAVNSSEPFQWFKLPWGEICLYSSLSDEMLYFPVYPEGFDDGVSAKYDEMPEMLYQYEPWKVYKSSGPREISFNFHFHRDMWTGDHRDGSANALIRGCQANCYANYDGSLINVSTVTLYLHGENLITGVMTDCKVKWDGPIGLDGFYLWCDLSFTISEVSPEALNYNTVRNKGLIG